MTIAIYVVSVLLAVACIGLFAVAMRRMFGRHEEVVSAMLDRYDDRLSEFAQTLNDAITPLTGAHPRGHRRATAALPR